MQLSINKNYSLITSIILLTEVLIATYIKTGFIRHTFGDILATMLVYTFFRSFLKTNPIKLGISVLIFAFSLEFFQFLNILDFFNIQNKIIRIVLGTTYQTSDLIAYTLGIVAIILIDIKLFKNEYY